MTATRGPSLTLRLTLLFALASALVLFLLGLLIGNAVESHFEEQDLEVLNGKMKLAKHILERSPGGQSKEILTQQLDDALTGHHGLIVVVYGANGETLYANEAMTFPPDFLVTTAPKQEQPVKWTTSDGLPWRGISSAVKLGAGGGAAYSVAIATEIAHHEHFMTSFRQTLWGFMGLATLAMGLLGWFAVRRGLIPLQAIKQQAAEITANRLHTRLPVESIPVELADLADTLNGMLSRLEESFQRLSDFSSDLAHELRTPVSNLLTQTQVTLSKVRSADDYRDILASNAEEFERLSRTISDMLFLAKADNDQIIPHQEVIEMAEEVADLLEYYEILAEEKEIKLSHTGQGRVIGDRLMLRRAISNLLSNAVRHTPNGGTIVTRIARTAEGSTVLTVENTGKTISPEHLPRLFDRFYRVDSSRFRTTENAGLGLAITRSILLAHGGDITASSGNGLTTFVMRLPNENIENG
ncbi:heavy metal sensor histidine kinase [Azonexus fungiphilus]|uniref:heavy metal sensor histidine kinase n=1 Tax=Azonexus fungiphilus TaxID=146940 RepID=UPI00156B9668|nr:heavy metal sensor histidine kinase [Azonexus fungiphilus]NHC08286.1 heavy metal sensor histidine kinase [Azonexus fungiphilus]